MKTLHVQKELEMLYSLTFLVDQSLQKQNQWSTHVFAE